VLFSGLRAEAARLYFEPQEPTIGTTGEFSVAINIDADKRVNAYSAAVSISGPLVPYDINEANSIINFWVEKAKWDETTRLLTFSGITPGGFEGEKGRLLVIKFKAEKEGEAVLGFDKEKTKVYLHTADGTEDSLELAELKLPIVKGKENIPVEIHDNEPPEWFSPEISQDPNMFGGKWFLVFATQDKASGIAGYFVHETTRKKDATLIDTKDWTEAESPYVLKDQKLRSYIYVKAVDKVGNERIVSLPPKYPLKWYELWWVWGIIVVAIVIIWLILLIFRKRRYLSRFSD
jgi:hypothetical protein